MGCCVSCVCVFASLGEVLRVLLFWDSLWVSLLGFVDALVFVARLGLWGVGECLPRTGCELWVIKMGVLVGVRELQCYDFGPCSDV